MDQTAAMVEEGGLSEKERSDAREVIQSSGSEEQIVERGRTMGGNRPAPRSRSRRRGCDGRHELLFWKPRICFTYIPSRVNPKHHPTRSSAF